jgi:hypothetical protein
MKKKELPTSYAFDILTKLFPFHARAPESIEYGVNATFNNISVISSLERFLALLEKKHLLLFNWVLFGC